MFNGKRIKENTMNSFWELKMFYSSIKKIHKFHFWNVSIILIFLRSKPTNARPILSRSLLFVANVLYPLLICWQRNSVKLKCKSNFFVREWKKLGIFEIFTKQWRNRVGVFRFKKNIRTSNKTEFNVYIHETYTKKFCFGSSIFMCIVYVWMPHRKLPLCEVYIFLFRNESCAWSRGSLIYIHLKYFMFVRVQFDCVANEFNVVVYFSCEDRTFSINSPTNNWETWREKNANLSGQASAQTGLTHTHYDY